MGDGKAEFNIPLYRYKRKGLQKETLNLKREIKEDGICCVFWYKRASKTPTDVTETFFVNSPWQTGL